LCQILFRPFLLNHPFNPDEWQVGQEFNNLLGDYRWWFRSAGPSDLFLLMRAFQGLIQQLQQLDVKLAWWPLLQQAVGNELIQYAMAYELPTIHSEPATDALRFDQQAAKLCVNVTKNGQPHVSVAMPAEAVLDLEHLILKMYWSASGSQEKSTSNNWAITSEPTALRLSNFLLLKTVARFIGSGWNSGVKALT